MIYKTNYSGWYCVSDETFLTESQLMENDKKQKVSIESGHPVQWTEEENYMFKLSNFHDDIVYWIKQRYFTIKFLILRDTTTIFVVAVNVLSQRNSKRRFLVTWMNH